MNEFKDKVAVITGAGSGFGREFARIGAALGMKLVLADIQEEALAATADELQAAGCRGAGAQGGRIRWRADRRAGIGHDASASAACTCCSTTPASARLAWSGKTPCRTGSGRWA